MIALLAIVIIVACYWVYHKLKVPDELRDLPTVSILSIVKSMLQHKHFGEQFESLIKPALASDGYAKVLSRDGWEVIVSKPEYIKQIYTKHELFRKNPIDPPRISIFLSLFGQSNILFSDGYEWKKHRKLFNPLFHRAWPTNIFSDCILDTLDELRESKLCSIRLRTFLLKLAFNILGKAIFGFDLDNVKHNGYPLYHYYQDTMDAFFENPLYLLFPILNQLPMLESRKALQLKIDQFNFILKKLIEKRNELAVSNSLNDRTDLLSMLGTFSDENDEAGLSYDDLRSNLVIFLIAGHETTANAIESVLYYLAINPEIQTRLRNQIKQVLGATSNIIVPTLEQLTKMDYLSAVIKEALRIMTTAATIRRYAHETFQLSNKLIIPKGTAVTIHNWALHHDERYFPDPCKFDPERFVNQGSLSDNNQWLYWSPFAYGSRTCLGKKFSLIEQQLTLSIFLQTYSVELDHTKTPPDPKLVEVPAAHFQDLWFKLSPLQ